jgi:hypothetical protein
MMFAYYFMMLTFDFVMLALIFGWLEIGKNLFCNVYIVFFYFCFKFQDVNITESHVFDWTWYLWMCFKHIVMRWLHIIFRSKHWFIICECFLDIGRYIFTFIFMMLTLYRNMSTLRMIMFVFCGKCGQGDSNISDCDLTNLFIDANIVLMFLCFFGKMDFYVHIVYNDVCITFYQFYIEIEHIYGLGVILWKWHKHLTSWCQHLILRCKDCVIVCSLFGANVGNMFTYEFMTQTLSFRMFPLYGQLYIHSHIWFLNL